LEIVARLAFAGESLSNNLAWLSRRFLRIVRHDVFPDGRSKAETTSADRNTHPSQYMSAPLEKSNASFRRHYLSAVKMAPATKRGPYKKRA
jgi:hypothetical protein